MKRLLVLILICMLAAALFAAVPTALADEAANDVKIGVDQVRNGDVLTVTVNLEKNDGVVGLVLRVEYDLSVLTLTKRTLGPALEELDPMDNFESLDTFEAPYIMSYFTGALENNTSTGRLFTLTFDVAAGNPNAAVQVFVCDLTYLNADTKATTNAKYMTNGTNKDADYSTGGVEITKSETAPDKLTPDEGSKALVIGLSVGGAAVVVIGTAIAFVLYKKKRK